MCADLVEPNKGVVIDSFPPPYIDELPANLRGAKLFSTTDLANICPSIRPVDVTAFITPDGLLRICRVPYGLASAHSVFQKMMATIL